MNGLNHFYYQSLLWQYFGTASAFHFNGGSKMKKKPLVLSEGDLRVMLELSEFKEFLDKQKQQQKTDERRKKQLAELSNSFGNDYLKKIKELQEHLLQEMPHLDKDSAYVMAEQMFEEGD